jgi:hypothetical protein
MTATHPSTRGVLVMIHLYDPLGKKNRVKKFSFFYRTKEFMLFCQKKRSRL